tara:strand:+ start:3668 stop:4663 length:996 start_codon:yes stop_codon:yes gene_type:complete
LVNIFFLGCVQKSEQQSHWKFAIEEISGSVQDVYAQEFRRRIEKASNGEIKVTVYPYGTIGTSDQITELVATGAIQLAMSSPGYLGKLIPELQVFSIPYLFPENIHQTKTPLTSGPTVKDYIAPLYRNKGLHFLAFLPEGWQVWTTNKKIQAPDDFEGFKMRVMTTPLLLKTFESFRANPTALNYSEVYSALQLKMIDGQVNPLFAIEEMKFYEVTDYLIFPQASHFITSLITSERFYEKLPEDKKKVLNRVVAEMQDFIFQKQEQINRERLAKMQKQKPDLNLVYLSEEQKQKFRNLSENVRKEYIKIGGPKAKMILQGLEKDFQEAAND